MRRLDGLPGHALHSAAATRAIEHAAMHGLAPHTLMQRAGLAVARLALALQPHARTIWIVCGPGNNGGDGLEAARHLHAWGKHCVVHWLGDDTTAPADARASARLAREAGVLINTGLPVTAPQADIVIDALLGIGAARPPSGLMAQAIAHTNDHGAPVLAVDLPSGLDADTGSVHRDEQHGQPLAVRATHTLSLLTLKPGLFTAHGRDHAGEIWLDDLGVRTDPPPAASAPCARLTDSRQATWPDRSGAPHASHKGSHGDVIVIGGAAGMTGAAVLAARAALAGGAGRVYVALLEQAAPGGRAPITLDPLWPELMLRDLTRPDAALDFRAATVVLGCGAGAMTDQVSQACLPRALGAHRLVLDADALNAIARDPSLQAQLEARGRRGRSGRSGGITVLTPHPLEAARLLGTDTGAVQADRLGAAATLSGRFGATVVLKGSGTVIHSPGELPAINPTGNARLATAGTGDVLAGLIGARLAQGDTPHLAALRAVHHHGQCADDWTPGPRGRAFTASSLLA